MDLIAGLGAYWTMDEASDGSAPVIRDDSHNINYLNDYLNCASVAGRAGNAVVTGGPVGAWLRISGGRQDGLAAGYDDFAVSFWYYHTVAELRTIFGTFGIGGDAAHAYLVYLNQDKPSIYTQGCSATFDAPFPTTYTWYHCVFNFDRDGNVDFYRNNVLVDSVDFTGAEAQYLAVSVYFFIGGGSPFASGANGAYFDEFGLWNRLLAVDEIDALFNGAVYPFSTPDPDPDPPEVSVMVSKSAKLYQERMQPDHRVTRRIPAPHHDMSINAAHTLDLHPPFPPSHILHAEDDKPPDSGLTEPWPFGEEEIS